MNYLNYSNYSTGKQPRSGCISIEKPYRRAQQPRSGCTCYCTDMQPLRGCFPEGDVISIDMKPLRGLSSKLYFYTALQHTVCQPANQNELKIIN